MVKIARTCAPRVARWALKLVYKGQIFLLVFTLSWNLEGQTSLKMQIFQKMKILFLEVWYSVLLIEVAVLTLEIFQGAFWGLFFEYFIKKFKKQNFLKILTFSFFLKFYS